MSPPRLPACPSLRGALATALLLTAPVALAGAPEAPSGLEVVSPDLEGGLRGHSGALRARVLPPGASLAKHLATTQGTPPRWVDLIAQKAASSPDGWEAPRQAGIWRMEMGGNSNSEALPAVITAVHFDGSRNHLNGYFIGRHPASASGRSGRYAPPEFFIEVTRENQDFALSEHFRLRHFLTKDQSDVWPKYLALDLRLVDKLELVLQELRAMGRPATRLHVMSGYRTPRYNGPGGKGRAKFSRHTYGDAADVWLDDDGDGQMDDLDGDGRIDAADARVLASAIERVEQRFPSLTGGHGLYPANRHHGPFVHVDVRGTPARWGRAPASPAGTRARGSKARRAAP